MLSAHQTRRCTRCGVVTCSCQTPKRPATCDRCTDELTRRAT